MKDALRVIVVGLLIMAVLFGTLGGIRWARRGGTAARLAASALMLGLGMGIVIQPPQQGVEQAEEEQDRTGGESGDPPVS